jgi:hypothetical protein
MPVFKKKLVTQQTTETGLRGLAHGALKSRWISEFVSEPSFHIDRGIWARLTQTIVRRGQYTETVIEPATGEKLHFESHPLVEHTAHGDAKKDDGRRHFNGRSVKP